MTYNEWKAKYVTNKDKNGIIKDKNVTIENLIDKLGVNINEYKPFGKYAPFNNDIQEKTSKLLNMDGLPTITNEKTYIKNQGYEIK